MKILLLGANGQIGWELQRSLSTLGRLKAYDRHSLDLTNFDLLEKLVYEYEPQVIVNAAAYTAVDKAESEPEIVNRINALASRILANTAKSLNSWYVHYSTDYIFDGKKTSPYNETDKANPLSVYGTSKWMGDKYTEESGCKYLIFRTSWVYSLRGNNFAKTILRMARERKGLKVVGDQVGSPTSAQLVADVTTLCLYKLINSSSESASQFIGTYNLSAADNTSWYGFAQYLIGGVRNFGFELMTSPEEIENIASKEYLCAARRPSNSCLDTAKIENEFDIKLPSWQVLADRFITEYTYRNYL